MLIGWPFFYTKSVHCFPLKNLQRKSDALLFEHKFSSGSGNATTQLYVKRFLVQFEWLDTKILAFSWSVPLAQITGHFFMVKSIKHYSTILLQFVPPTLVPVWPIYLQLSSSKQKFSCRSFKISKGKFRISQWFCYSHYWWIPKLVGLSNFLVQSHIYQNFPVSANFETEFLFAKSRWMKIFRPNRYLM